MLVSRLFANWFVGSGVNEVSWQQRHPTDTATKEDRGGKESRNERNSQEWGR